MNKIIKYNNKQQKKKTFDEHKALINNKRCHKRNTLKLNSSNIQGNTKRTAILTVLINWSQLPS